MNSKRSELRLVLMGARATLLAAFLGAFAVGACSDDAADEGDDSGEAGAGSPNTGGTVGFAGSGGTVGFAGSGGTVGGGGTAGGGRSGAGNAGSSSTPACGARGSPCDSNTDCCAIDTGMLCQQLGMCCPGGKGGNGVLCALDDDCCSGHCDPGQTGTAPQCCSQGDGACLSTSDCCYGLSCDGELPNGVQTCCKPLGTECIAGDKCCGGGGCGRGCLPLGRRRLRRDRRRVLLARRELVSRRRGLLPSRRRHRRAVLPRKLLLQHPLAVHQGRGMLRHRVHRGLLRRAAAVAAAPVISRPAE